MKTSYVAVAVFFGLCAGLLTIWFCFDLVGNDSPKWLLLILAAVLIGLMCQMIGQVARMNRKPAWRASGPVFTKSSSGSAGEAPDTVVVLDEDPTAPDASIDVAATEALKKMGIE